MKLHINPWPLLGLALLALSAALVIETAVVITTYLRQPAACTTDSECMRLCPQADTECDGGPDGGIVT